MEVRVLNYEAVRLDILHQYHLDSIAEAVFDELSRLASLVCQAPIAFICVGESDRPCLKSQVGWDDARDQHLVEFYRCTLRAHDLVIVPNAQIEEPFTTHPFVVQDPGFRFYAGVPLITAEGLAVGVLGVFDRVVRSLTPDQQAGLKALSHQMIAQMELHCKAADLRDATHRWKEAEQAQELLFTMAPDLTCMIGFDGYFKRLNPSWTEIVGFTNAELMALPFISFIHPEDIEATQTRIQQLHQGATRARFEHRYRCNDESYRWLVWNMAILPGRQLLYGTARDITERKQGEKTIQKSLQELEDLKFAIDQHAIVAITNAKDQKLAEVALRERSHLAELSALVGITLAKGGDLPEVLETCAETIVQSLDATFVRIWTHNPETQLLELQAIAGQLSHTEEFHSRIPLGISIIGFIAQTRVPYHTNDVLNDVCMGAKDWMRREALVSFAGYPLVVEDHLVGVLALFSRKPFTEAILNTLGWLAPNIAVSIDRSWARKELLSQREAFLFRLASQIRDSLNLDVILTTTVSEIRTLLKIDRCHFIWCWTNNQQPDLVITHESRNLDLPALVGDCPMEQVNYLTDRILNLQMIQVNQVAVEPDIDPALKTMLQTAGSSAYLLIPLETRSSQLGALVCSHSSPHNWSDSEVELLQGVVDQVAIAIDQAELYAKTRAAAFAAENQAQQLSEALQDLQQTQTQLIQTEKMSSLGQMVAGIAHEINNPINFINGNLIHANNYAQDLLEIVRLYQQHYPHPTAEIQEKADLIDIDFISNDLPKLLSSMKIGTDRIRQIVLSLRNFSRLDEAEMKPVDIHDGIDSTLLILHNRLKAGVTHTGIQIVKKYGTLPPVECYPGQLNQVFMNIIANAIDALEEQPAPRIITIQTEFVPLEEAIAPIALPVSMLETPDAEHSCSILSTRQGTVVIRICDNGLGMTPAVKDKLFDPFFTTKPVGKGTGLGMSISYQIVVQKHGGNLECRSEPDHGSEFIITIPATQCNS